MAAKAKRATTTRPRITPSENAFLCYLRLHSDIAKSYGIKQCSLTTSPVSMLMQTMEAQGCDVKWYERLPNGVPHEDATTNEKAAAHIQWIKRRPGKWLQQLKDRPKVAPPDKAAVMRKHRHGTRSLPKHFFEKLKGRPRRPKLSSACYNKFVAPAAVALVEKDRIVSFVQSKLRCACGGYLRFDKRGSHQCGVCASWQFACEKGCNVPPLLTSGHAHGDDYELNALVNYGIITCALSFARMVPFLVLLGLRAPSTTDHYATKDEVDPILADQAECSMAGAHERNVKAGTLDYISVDGGFTHSRNADGCSMGAHAPDGAIVAIEHKRLTDVGAKSSKSLEILCYLSLLCHVRVLLYKQTVMDGCRELVYPTLAAGKTAAGDLWHSGKNWAKWFLLAITQLCRSAKPAAGKIVKVAKPKKIEASRLEDYGTCPAGTKAVDFARQRVIALGGDPPAEAKTPALKALFGCALSPHTTHPSPLYIFIVFSSAQVPMPTQKTFHQEGDDSRGMCT